MGLLGMVVLNRTIGLKNNVESDDSTSGKYTEVPLAGVGLIGGPNEPGDTDPENTPATIVEATSSLGWDYHNRSLVIDFGSRKAINRITLFDGAVDNHGTASNLNQESVRIYYSDDNKKYVKYDRAYDINAKKGAGMTSDEKPVFDIVEIDNASIKARYIKLNAVCSGAPANFIMRNARTAIKAFQSPSEHFGIKDIYLENRILTLGKNKLHSEVIVPEGRRARMIVELTSGAETWTVSTADVRQPGKVTCDFKVDELKPGSYELACRLQSENGDVEAERKLKLKLFTRLVPFKELSQAKSVSAGGGEMMIIDDFRNLIKDADCTFASYKNVITQKMKTLLVLRKGINPLKVPLPANGWCAIYIGLKSDSGGIKLHLDGDNKQAKVFTPGKDVRKDIDLVTDVFFQYAELDNQSLILEPVDAQEACLAYIKVMCLTQKQMELVKGENDISLGKKYVYTCDAYKDWSKYDIPKLIGRFAGHPEVEAVAWDIGGSVMYCPTKIGTMLGEARDFPRKSDKDFVDSLEELIRSGNVPVDIAIKEAHRIGIKLYGTLRMNAEYRPPYEKLFNSKFWWEHPEYRIVSGKAGGKHSYMSYVFPEVRKYKLDLLREFVENHDVDGIHLEFLRNPPYFGYEQPLVDGFKKKYGIDVLSPEFRPDERWHEYRSGFMTEFMRDLRKTLDEVGKKNGKHLQLTARVDCNEYLRQGLDVKTWIKEGLIDMVAAGVNGLGYPYAPADDFVKMAKGTTCRVYGSTSPEMAGYRDPTAEDDKTGFKFFPKTKGVTLDASKRRHLEYFKAGAQGMFLFNDKGDHYVGEYTHLERWEEFEDPLNLNVAQITMSGPNKGTAK